MKTALILLVALTALAAQGEDLAGHYILQGVMEVGSELLLKPDGTFEYMLAYGAADYWAKGTWRLDGKSVVLQSDGKKDAPFKLLRSEPGKAGRIKVWVLGRNGSPVPNIDVLLRAGDERLDERTDSDGVAVFQDKPGASAVMFDVRVYGVEAGPFEIKPPNKDFYFEINGDAIQQVLFKDEHLAIDQNGLLMTYWKQGPPMHYVKK